MEQALQVTMHAYGVVNYLLYLHLPLCPYSGHRPFLFVQSRAHSGECLKDSLDPLFKCRSMEVVPDHFHFLAFPYR